MLIYCGGGFIPGVPARDLSEEEVGELAQKFDRPDMALVLIQSGLYQEAKSDRVKAKAINPEEKEK